MDTGLEALATALYVTVDDLLKDHPEVLPPRPQVDITAVTSDAEIITLAVVQALLGYTSKTRWIRRLRSDTDLRAMFPRVPGQSGYNKRIHSLTATMTWVCAALRRGSRVDDDTVWLVDSTPIECARSRPDALSPGGMGRVRVTSASHSRFFWGLRLHLVCTVHGLPVGWALTGAKADERETLLAVLATMDRPAQDGQVVIADKNYYGAAFEAELAKGGITLIRPRRKGERPRSSQRFLRPLRQIIESVNDTLKGQLDLEGHGGRTPAGVCSRITQRILALTAAIWHNSLTNAPVLRTLPPLQPLTPLGLTHLVGVWGWDELYEKYKDGGRGINTNIGGLRDQYICHQQFAFLKDRWNLDEWRPDVSYPSTVAAGCNPG